MRKKLVGMTKQEKEKLTQILGNNLRIAREMNGFTRRQVMKEVFDGNGRNLNRISEVEHGNLMPSVMHILRFAQMYNVSLDFLFGRTNEPDFLCEDAYVGRAVSSIRHLGIDMMDGLTKILIEQAQSLPKSDSIALMEAARELIQGVLLAPKSILENQENLKRLLNDLNNALVQAERNYAKKQVRFNITFDDAISEQRLHKNKLLVEKPNHSLTAMQKKLTEQTQRQPDLFL